MDCVSRRKSRPVLCPPPRSQWLGVHAQVACLVVRVRRRVPELVVVHFVARTQDCLPRLRVAPVRQARPSILRAAQQCNNRRMDCSACLAVCGGVMTGDAYLFHRLGGFSGGVSLAEPLLPASSLTRNTRNRVQDVQEGAVHLYRLSFLSFLGAFLLNAIERNQAADGPPGRMAPPPFGGRIKMNGADRHPALDARAGRGLYHHRSRAHYTRPPCPSFKRAFSAPVPQVAFVTRRTTLRRRREPACSFYFTISRSPSSLASCLRTRAQHAAHALTRASLNLACGCHPIFVVARALCGTVRSAIGSHECEFCDSTHQVHLIEVRGSVSFVSVCWSPPGPSRAIGHGPSRAIVGDSARPPGRAAACSQQAMPSQAPERNDKAPCLVTYDRGVSLLVSS